ncbi:uncharacterized protein LOC116295195 [Actinia tenebrosa]|uniref:Uncharacterized protein LOC116295195 n=1 Tax=Actinia tenebrosa TaxID=6105 RepID=A0A6P8HR19_ACTTE|nr:uncharacterized protein LOC116295195 [Actinia tenebrosa]
MIIILRLTFIHLGSDRSIQYLTLMLFKRALTQISPQNFVPDSKTKCLQLSLSNEFSSILEEIKQKHTLIFQLFGEPGSGCSTLVQGLCQHLCEIEHIAEKEILYLSLNGCCNEKSLWEFMSDLAKERNHKEQATFFSATSEKKDEKIKRFLGFFNFKVVCFDNADCNDGLVESFLEHLVCSKIKTFIIGTQTRQIQTNAQVSTIEVRGLNLSTAQELFKKLCPSCAYEDGQISSLCGILKYNPIAINFFCALVNSHKLDATQLQLSKGERRVDMFALDWILDYIKQSLEPSYISILYQLCHLRRPLPMTEVTPEISKLMELNLLTVKKEGSVNVIAIDSCLQKYLSCKRDMNTDKDAVQQTADFSVLKCWLSLVCFKLQNLVQDAEGNAWPFVEEKWQFAREVSKEENYNVQDLLTSKNHDVPSLTELQILQVRLSFFLLRIQMKGAHFRVAVIYYPFVVPKYNIVKYIINVINVLRMKSFSSCIHTHRQCFARSYGILCRCLRNMTITDYNTFAQTFGLVTCHPLLAAYFCSQEAAEWSSYTPLFFVRHTYQAGEVLFEYLILIPDKNEKQHLLRIAIEDLKDSIQAHQSYPSLTSREQFYLLVCAVYRISLALFQIGSNEDKEKGMKLKDLSTELYEHYCLSSDRVPLTNTMTGMVDQCLSLLGLKAFSQDNLANAGDVLVNYFKMRKTVRQNENYRLSSVGFFENLNKHEIRNEVRVANFTKSKNAQQNLRNQVLKKTVDHDLCLAKMQEEQAQEGHTVDRCADTAEMQEEQAQEGHTVDQCTDTAEMQEEKPQGHTVDRCADTAEKSSEEQALQTRATLEKLSSMTMEKGEGMVMQSLENEAASLIRASQTMPFFPLDELKAANSKSNRVKDAILWKYDYPTSQWRGQSTMVYIGDQLKLAKEKEGSHRDVYAVEFINENEQRRRYVAKRYRKYKTMQQYQNDVLSQMKAKQYVALFNQQLYQKAAGVPVGDIQFLPVVLLQLVNSNGQTEIFNAEPYMSGEFIKLTNNTDWINKHRRTDLVLAYSHFTYQASDGKLIIVDIQGWAPLDNQGCTFLTDPQIHSTVYKCFGTGNFGKEGYDNFWKMHPECNKICKMLGLERPPYK